MLSESEYIKLTAPKSIALVGVTGRTGPQSLSPLQVLLNKGYKGRVYPINPKGGETLGLKVYTSVLDIPEVPDLAMICAPRDAVPELFDMCAVKGIKLVIITAQGFFDGDAGGIVMQHKLIDAAKTNNIRVLGPNTLGIINNFEQTNTSFTDFINITQPIGITCMTGAFYLGAPQYCGGTGILIDSGNTMDICVTDVLLHLARDTRLKVINIHMEGLSGGPEFMEVAKEAAGLKPIVIYKTGVSDAGSKAARSHTGSLSGEDRVFDAAFKECGLIRIQNLDEMKDLNKTFCTFNGINGNRIGIISASGGLGVMAADACARNGLEVAALSEATNEELGGLFPKWAHCQNPMDVWPACMFCGVRPGFSLILETYLKDPGIDAVICCLPSFVTSDPDNAFLDATDLLREIVGRYPHKPVAMTSFGGNFLDIQEKMERDQTTVFYFSMERAAKSLAELYRYHHLIKNKDFTSTETEGGAGQPTEDAGRDPDRPNEPQTLSTGLLVGKSGNLPQDSALELLREYSIPTVRWDKANSLAQATAMADAIGYPVAMKILSPDIIHKSDLGGVKLGIENSGQLEEAYNAMMKEIKQKQPGAAIEGVVIQEQLSGGIELLLGCKKDPTFGPVLVFGAGGIFAEILDDISLGFIPLGRKEAEKMIADTKISKILVGARGREAVDMELLISCLQNLAKLVQANPTIIELDINPLLAFPNRIVALDARVILD